MHMILGSYKRSLLIFSRLVFYLTVFPQTIFGHGINNLSCIPFLHYFTSSLYTVLLSLKFIFWPAILDLCGYAFFIFVFKRTTEWIFLSFIFIHKNVLFLLSLIDFFFECSIFSIYYILKEWNIWDICCLCSNKQRRI